jgi:sugar O-acyltransferase (sialic acid O-acetyltransferase NeuD family)
MRSPARRAPAQRAASARRSTRENLVVFGSGELAKVVIDIIERGDRYHIVGLVDPSASIGRMVYDYPVLGGDDDLPRVLETHAIGGGIVAIGDNWKRHLVADAILARIPDFRFVTAIHPSVPVARGAVLGRGTIAAAGSIIQSDARIGEFCLLGGIIGPENTIGDFAALAPGTITGGSVRIGAFSAIGLGAQIIHGQSIGEHVVVGAGAVVTGDIESYAVAHGSRARTIRVRKAGDPYF